MQIFILGRTVAEQHRFAEMVQNRLGATPETLPVFSATLTTYARAGSIEGIQAEELDGIPLTAYIDECAPAASDPNEAYRLWRQWFAAENLLVIGADTPDVFVSLMAHDDRNAVIYLEAESEDEPAPPTAAQAAIAAYLGWQDTRRPVPAYRLGAAEFDALLNGEAIYDGPSDAFLELWLPEGLAFTDNWDGPPNTEFENHGLCARVIPSNGSAAPKIAHPCAVIPYTT